MIPNTNYAQIEILHNVKFKYNATELSNTCVGEGGDKNKDERLVLECAKCPSQMTHAPAFQLSLATRPNILEVESNPGS